MKSMGSILICMIQSCSPWLGYRKGEPHPQPNSIGDLILYVLNSKLCFKAVHNFHVHSSTLQERSRQLTGVHPPFLSLTSYSEMSAELSVAGVGPGSLWAFLPLPAFPIDHFCRSCIITRVPPLLRRRQWHPTPVLLPGKSHGRRTLVGRSPWGR